MNSTSLTGSCLCGGVQYQVRLPLGTMEYCHCSRCRKAQGSAFSAYTAVPSDQVQVTVGAELLSQYASAPQRLRCFCSRCGSPLFIQRLGEAAFTVLHLGTLELEPGAGPERHVFTASKAAWHEIGDTLPQYKIYPGFEPEDPPQQPLPSSPSEP